MEQAGISVEAGPRGQLGPEYQFDFDSNTEAEADGFDFGLGGADEQTEHAEATPNNVAAVNPDPKLGYDEEETPAEAAVDEQPQTDEVPQDADGDVDAEAEYHDEIGYEDDDDLVTADVNADSGPTADDGTGAGLSNGLPEGDAEPAQSVVEDHPEVSVSAHEKDSDLESEEHGESVDPEGDFPGADVEDVADHAEGDDLAAENANTETVDEESAPDRYDEPHPGLSDVDKAIQGLTHALHGIPDIEVVYNDECYSLFGTPDENPDSYFLSDIEELDRPLSQFLSALRAVISNEVDAADELVIRFDALDLEFGERSNEKFLNRSFREVLECYAALAAKDSDISSDPVVHLMVRRDSEERFLELLADAQLGDAGSEVAQDVEAPVDNDEEPQVTARDDGHPLHESSTERDLDDHHAHGDDTTSATTPAHVTTDLAEGKDQSEFEAAQDEDGLTGEHEGHAQDHENAAQSPQPPAEDIHVDENLEDDSAEAYRHEHPEDGAGGDQDWDELAEEDGAAVPQDAAASPEAFDGQAHQEAADEDGNEPGDTTDPRTTEVPAVPEDDRSEQGGTGLNGKRSFFLSSATPTFLGHKPAAPVPLQSDDSEDSHEGPLHSVSAFGVGQEPIGTCEQTRTQASSSSSAAPEETGPWEIDYSDGEYEQASSVPLASQGAAHADLAGDAVDGKLVLGEVLKPRGHSITVSSNIANMPVQDDELELAFDDDGGLSTAREEGEEVEEEEEEEEYSIVYEATAEMAVDDDGVQEPHVSEDASDSISKNAQNGAQVAVAAEAASVHPSAASDSDEIDYEVQIAAEGSPARAEDSVQQVFPTSGAEGDEIDWENDVDEYEQQPASADEGVEQDEPKDVTLTPSSFAGKRSRADEAESLADETGMAVCPCPKRARLC